MGGGAGPSVAASERLGTPYRRLVGLLRPYGGSLAAVVVAAVVCGALDTGCTSF